jgi:hypothetical protein
MNSVVTYHHSELANTALRLPHAGIRPTFLTHYRVRGIASDIAMVVAVLAFVMSFVTLRMTLFAPANVVERVAIPLATGGAVVFVLAFFASLALRPRRGAGT